MARRYSNTEKVAIVILSLGEELGAEILKQLPQHEARKVATALQRLGRVDGEEADGILREFQNGLKNQRPALFGSAQFAQKALSKAYGYTEGTATARDLGLDFAPGLPALEGADPKILANYLTREHPQTMAIVVAHCESQQAGEVIKLLPAHLQTEVLIRIANLEPVEPETLELLNDAIKEEVERSSLRASFSLGGAEAVAKVLNALPPQQRAAIMEKLEELHPSTLADIKQKMFTFQDLLKLTPKGIDTLITNIKNETLRLALKPNEAAIRNIFLQRMSTRAQERLLEDIAAMPLVSMTDVNHARQTIVNLATEFIEQGKIEVRDENEVYV